MLRIFLFGLSNRRKQPERYVPFFLNKMRRIRAAHNKTIDKME
jgi:hypothetical protein